MRKNLRSAFNTRQYMLSRDFEIYYYSDLNFKAVDPHRHTYYEFYILLEGNVYIEIEGRKIPLQKGSIARCYAPQHLNGSGHALPALCLLDQ